MAKKKKEKSAKDAQSLAKKAKDTALKNQKKSGGKAGFKAQLVFTFAILGGVIFLPTTIVLAVGMVPSFVAFFIDRSKKKSKGIAVGAMNLAGCSPFLLEMWVSEHTVAQAMSILADPMAIVVMYSAAGVGYLLEWSVTGVVASFMYQKGLLRQDAIIVRQESLIERWGREVTGDVALDEYGFSIEKEVKKEAVAGAKEDKKEARRR